MALRLTRTFFCNSVVANKWLIKAFLSILLERGEMIILTGFVSSLSSLKSSIIVIFFESICEAICSSIFDEEIW